MCVGVWVGLGHLLGQILEVMQMGVHDHLLHERKIAVLLVVDLNHPPRVLPTPDHGPLNLVRVGAADNRERDRALDGKRGWVNRERQAKSTASVLCDCCSIAKAPLHPQALPPPP